MSQDNDATCSIADSDLRSGKVHMGNDSLEASKRPRSAAQIAAFEKARAKRAENVAKLAKKTQKDPDTTSEVEPEPIAQEVSVKRKPRKYKGKSRGRLVRTQEVVEENVEFSAPAPYFVIV